MFSHFEPIKQSDGWLQSAEKLAKETNFLLAFSHVLISKQYAIKKSQNIHKKMITWNFFGGPHRTGCKGKRVQWQNIVLSSTDARTFCTSCPIIAHCEFLSFIAGIQFNCLWSSKNTTKNNFCYAGTSVAQHNDQSRGLFDCLAAFFGCLTWMLLQLMECALHHTLRNEFVWWESCSSWDWLAIPR